MGMNPLEVSSTIKDALGVPNAPENIESNEVVIPLALPLRLVNMGLLNFPSMMAVLNNLSK